MDTFPGWGKNCWDPEFRAEILPFQSLSRGNPVEGEIYKRCSTWASITPRDTVTWPRLMVPLSWTGNHFLKEIILHDMTCLFSGHETYRVINEVKIQSCIPYSLLPCSTMHYRISVYFLALVVFCTLITHMGNASFTLLAPITNSV